MKYGDFFPSNHALRSVNNRPRRWSRLKAWLHQWKPLITWSEK